MRPPSFGRTYIKIILRDIRQSLGRVAALFAIVALGVGFLAGLLAATPDMKLSMDRYFDRTNMMDIFIKASLGFSEADVAALEGMDETALVQPARVMDSLALTAAGETLAARIYGLPLDQAAGADFVNRMELVAGRFPEKDDECLVQQGGGYFADFALGDTFSVAPFDSGDQKTYRVEAYTVTGIAKSPLFIALDREPAGIGKGRLETALYVRDSSFALPAYTDVYLTLEGRQRFASFSDPYQRFVDGAKARIEEAGRRRSPIRHAEILAEARGKGQTALDGGTEAWEKGRDRVREELAGALKKLEDGAAELERAGEDLRSGEERIAQGRATLAAEQERAGKELADNGALLLAGEAEIALGRRTLAESKAQLDAAREEVERTRASRFRMGTARGREGVAQYDAGLKAWEEGSALLAEKAEELRLGRIALEEGRARAAAEFLSAGEELDAAERELDAGRRSLADADRELERGKAEFEAARAEAEAELRRGEEELLDARRKIDDIAVGEARWYVLDRGANVGAAYYRANVEKIASLARVFPLFFLLVAALVTLTTMTRMVEEERTRIGALKALGYPKGAILAKYLVYCALTGVLGSVAGMASGFWGLPIIIYNAFGTMYRLPPLVLEFDWRFGLLACAAALLCVTGATEGAVYGSLREKPAALLRPRPPRAGKRILLESIPFVWRRMKFTSKVAARNLMRYKRHFFMTVTGIAGCTSLMLAGFGLRDSLVYIARAQFEQIFKYDLRVELKKGDDGTEPADIRGIAGGLLGEAAETHFSGAYIITPDKRAEVSLCVPERAETLGGFIRLGNRNTALDFAADSAVITEKLAELLDLKPGSRFVLENADGKQGECVVTGVTENYVGNYCYLGAAAYEGIFGGSCSYDTLLAKTGVTEDGRREDLLRRLLASDSVMSAEFTSQTRTSYNNLLSSISLVVLILVAAAGGLALIVLYNLTYINISERSRELATLRVLGFHQGEAAAYIFREITVLSIAGALAGLALGVPLHRFIVGVAETADLMFGRKIAPQSYVFSGAITLCFSFLADMLMLKKIRNIGMIESMKAVE
jgi:putative ABC transport system permease protein